MEQKEPPLITTGNREITPRTFPHLHHDVSDVAVQMLIRVLQALSVVVLA